MRRGVRYYRAIPPPREEWEPDYAAIAKAGFHFVVVPVPWGWCHVGDEEFDFAPVLEQLDLARRNAVHLVAAIELTCAPAWLTARCPDCLHQDGDGAKVHIYTTRGGATGGWPGKSPNARACT